MHSASPRCHSLRRTVLAAALALAGCDTLVTAGPPDDETLAGPIPGLSGPQLARHLAGDAEFGRVFSAEEGKSRGPFGGTHAGVRNLLLTHPARRYAPQPNHWLMG